VLTALSSLFWSLGDARMEDATVEAVALLEAQPPGPELVAAYAVLAGARFVGNGFPEAIAAAERALSLAGGLGLPEPARALGFRGGARSSLGERQGLEDMRRALELALERGEGRAAAVLHNNLAFASWQYEGPQAAFERCRAGIDFCERRGITEYALRIAAMSPSFVAELGRPEQALVEAEPVAERMEAAGDFTFIEPRSLQLRLLAERGAHEHAPSAEQLLAIARESGEPQRCALVFSAGARLLLAQGQLQQARALLVELEQVADTGADPYYVSLLPGLVRTAHVLGQPELAGRLVDGVEPRMPLFEHALSACQAQLAEAAGDHARAAGLYAEAAERWREFGNVPERAYALLGQGRCLTALGKPGAAEPLRGAQELFVSMGYKPALAETEALLGESEAAAV
jgi:tetratricopeptide (TPR) repeat protein